MKDLYVVNCCRTAIGSFGGSLKNTPAAEMGAVVVKEALKRANIAPENVDEVMFGCILTAAQGQNVARQVAIKAGIPYSVPAYTVGMVCGSGMKSMIEGARSILAGDADVVVCGGTENMSAAPYAVPTGRYGARMGHTQMIDTMIKDGLWDAFNNYHMGTTAENIADIWGITRKEMDEFAASSQQKTEAAQAAGRFDEVVVTVVVNPNKSGMFSVDERIALIEEDCADLPNVRVDRWTGLLVDYLTENSYSTIVKGLRSGVDFDYEVPMAQMNRELSDVETVFLFSWAVVVQELGVYGLVSILFFLVVLILGLAYAWRKGALEWK